MTGGQRIRQMCGGYWFRVAGASVTAAALVVALLAPFTSGSVVAMMVRALTHATIMGSLCALVVPRIFGRLEPRRFGVRMGVTVAALLGLAVIGSLLARGLFVLTGLGAGQVFWPAFGFDVRINALLSVIIGVGMMLYEAQRARLDAVTLELRVKELEHERDRKMALEARLASLESRLQPHFLFNTLNAISALIQEDPERAERTVERLAALLRFSLDAAEAGVVPLVHELKIVGDYLEIEKTRLGERLAYAVHVARGVEGCEVPPLAVQTLVENSVKHAIAPRPRGGRIRVEASAVGDRIVLGVWDDGPGFSAADMPSGHGLDNLRGRLAGRFGDRASMGVARHEGGTLVTVSIPRNGLGER